MLGQVKGILYAVFVCLVFVVTSCHPNSAAEKEELLPPPVALKVPLADSIESYPKSDVQLQAHGRTILDIYVVDEGENVQWAPKTAYWEKPFTFNRDTLCYERTDSSGELLSFCNASNYGLSAMPIKVGNFVERKTKLPDNCSQDQPLTELQTQGLIKLEEQAVPLSKGVGWFYNYDTNANDMILHAPFPSAFSQAVNIHALLFAHCKTGEDKYLQLAIKGAEGLLLPYGENGVRYGDFFEESPMPRKYLPYILNGHLYSVAILYAVHDVTGDEKYLRHAERGKDWFTKNVDLYDSGAWTRYDLRPKSGYIYHEVHFTNETTMKALIMSSGNSKWTVCERGCDQDASAVRNGNSWRIIAKLPDLFEYEIGETVHVELEYDGDTPRIFGGMPRGSKTELWSIAMDNKSYDIPVADIGWSPVGPDYMEWHAFLVGELAEWTGDEDLQKISQRWYGYLEAYQNDSSEERLRTRPQ